MRPDTKSWGGGGKQVRPNTQSGGGGGRNRCDPTQNPGGKQVRPNTQSGGEGGETGATRHKIRGGKRCDQTRNPGGGGEKQVRLDTKSGGGTGATKHAILEGGGKKQVRPNTQFGGGGGGVCRMLIVFGVCSGGARGYCTREGGPGGGQAAVPEPGHRTASTQVSTAHCSFPLPPKCHGGWGGGGVSKYNLLPLGGEQRISPPPPPGVSTAYCPPGEVSAAHCTARFSSCG